MNKLKLFEKMYGHCWGKNLNVHFSIFIVSGSYYRFKREDNIKLGLWGREGLEDITSGHSGSVCRWIGVVIGVIGNYVSWVGILGQCVGGLEW